MLAIALRPWPKVIPAMLDFARTTRMGTVMLTDPTNTARARRHGATALTCQVSTPGAEISHTTVLCMVHLIVAALAARVGVAAIRRRDLIDDLREELDPDE
jgi:DNA-binding MurR/RpiR family transcriptional regulator